MITALAVLGTVLGAGLIGWAVELVGDLVTGDVDIAEGAGAFAFIASLILGIALIF